MSTHYLQLTQEKRYQIWSFARNRSQATGIGKIVGVDFSIVSRKLRHNRSIDGHDPLV